MSADLEGVKLDSVDIIPAPLRSESQIISRVPPELLTAIFLYCAGHDFDSEESAKAHPFHDMTGARGRPSWISVTQVSQKWRQVSVGYPHLWRMIPNDLSTQWIEAHFEHSNSVPLIIEVNLKCEKWTAGDRLLRLLLTNTYRLQELYLVDRFASDQPIVPTLCKFVDPAPLLQTLIINGYEPDEYLPSQLFGGFTPSLRRLQLSDNLGLDSSSSFLRELREFHYGFASSIDSVIKVLKEMPKLEILDLTGVSDDWDGEDDIIISDMVQLPCLSEFIFKPLRLEDLYYFLAHSQFSPTTRLDILLALAYGSYVPRDNCWPQALDLVARHYLQPTRKSRGPFQDIFLHISPYSAAFIGWTSLQPAEPVIDTQGPWYTSLYEPSSDRPPHVPFSFHYPGDSQDAWGTFYVDMELMCFLFDVAHVRNAWLDVDTCCKRDLVELQPYVLKAAQSTSWIPTLRLLRSVQLLKLTWKAVRGVLRALVSVGLDLPGVPAGQPPEGRIGILCPNLHTLIIMEAKLSRKKSIFPDLLELVKRRHDCGAGIPELVLQGCKVGEKELRMLGRYTKVSRWGNGTGDGYFVLFLRTYP
ncbi:hypothetical protein EWM64_g8057 [Hericium alpestre]|uniref:F-box domain-containing protein n=1 Tax=Hericium alpestre TaxID=135208 RepID=A0A4Y9ZPK6_9AGAM|nr:hypothetical protein EWM64_g8057 [Hericium alpestre]